MSVQPATGVAGFLTRYDGLRDRLPGDPTPRDAAARAFRTLGLPGAAAGRREEAWKYTSLRPLADAPFHPPLSTVGADAAGLLRLAPARLVFVDGRYRPDLSDLPVDLPDGATFASFADAPGFGTLARPERDPLVALNTMLAEDGARIAVPAGVDAGVVQLASLATEAQGRSTAFHPRHAIRLGAGARLTLLETATGAGTYLHNPVTEIVLDPGAVLHHVRFADEAAGAFHLATLYAELAEGAVYDGFTLVLGARVARSEFHVRLAGADARAAINAAQLLGGTQHADVTSVVRHDAPGGTSRQAVKNVLTGRSRGVFQGRIEVARDAQKTDGYQMSQALLLSDQAEIDTKPELEIFADDVKCSHGATVGALDPEQMFYLRSRGVPEAEARAMLVHAFLTDALEAVAHEPTRAALDAAVTGWWERAGA
jgi:Fe-S cluster assembly protein SufD